MPNGDVINERLEFQERIKKLPPGEQVVEVALMVYDMKTEMSSLGGGYSKKGSVLSATSISAALIALFEGIKLLLGKS